MNEDHVLKNGTKVEILRKKIEFDEFTDTPPNEKKANIVQVCHITLMKIFFFN